MNGLNQRAAEFELNRSETWTERHRICFQEILSDCPGQGADVSIAYLYYSGWCSDQNLWHSRGSFIRTLRAAGYVVRCRMIQDVKLAPGPMIYRLPMKGDLSIVDVRRLFGVSTGVLNALRRYGGGAPYKRLRTGIYYPRALFRDWLRQTTTTHLKLQYQEVPILLRHCLAEICSIRAIEWRRARRTGQEHPKLMHGSKNGRVAWSDLLSAVEQWFEIEMGDVPLNLPSQLRSILRFLGCRPTRIRLQGRRVPYVAGIWLKE